MTHERDMLLAVFAGRLGFAKADGLLACAKELLRGGETRPFGQLLLDRKLVTSPQLVLLEGMVNRSLDVVGGDPKRTVELLPKEQQQLVRAMFPAEPTTELDVELTRELKPQLEHAPDAVCTEQPGRYTTLKGADGQPIDLGGGGGGRVVLVHDTVLGREVALKTPAKPDAKQEPQDTLTSTAAAARFLREARLAAQLDHPAVLPVYELGKRADGQNYYTMMRVKGRTLATAIQDAKHLQGRLALVSSFLPVCQCIAYAHSRGVVHRDLKPQNVMLGPFGEVYVIDWGLARKRDQADPRAKDLALAPDISGVLSVKIVGTPAYMSPEQAWGEVDHIDERSDVWGLGAMLYELLTGRPPYVAATTVEVLAQVRTVDPEPVASLARGAPKELLAVCQKALARDPQRRYANADELARDVQAFLNGRRVGAYDYSFFELARRFVAKQKFVVATATALVLAAAVAGVTGTLQAQRERDAARRFAEVFIDDVADKLAPVPGVLGLVEKVNQAALKHFQRTLDVERAPHDQRLRVARAFLKLGSLQRDLGRFAEASQNAEYGLKLVDSVLAEAPGDAHAMALESSGLHARALVLRAQGDTKGWAQNLEAALPWAEKAGARLPEDLDVLDIEVATLSDLGHRALLENDVATARRHYERAVELDRRVLQLEKQKDVAATTLSEDYAELALVADAEKNRPEALKLADKALESAREAVRINPQHRNHTLNLVKRLTSKADLQRRVDPSVDIAPLLTEAEQLMERLLAEQPDDTFSAVMMVDVQSQLEHWGKAFRVLKGVEARGALTDVGSVAPAIAFLAGEYDECSRIAQLRFLEGDGTALVYRAMSAAMSGRAAETAISLRAARGQLATLQWLPGAVLKQAKGSSPLVEATREFAKAMDAAVLARDDAASARALETYVAAVEKALPVENTPR